MITLQKLDIHQVTQSGINYILIKTCFAPLLSLVIGIVFVVLIFKIKKVVSIEFQIKGKNIFFLPTAVVLIVNVVIVASFILGCYKLYNTYEFGIDVEEMRSVVRREKTVVHAAGTYKNGEAVYTYSNSKEALENCYDNGNHIAELDFIWTSDDQLVCGHDDEEGWCYGIDSRSALSETEFLNSKLFGSLTTMGVNNLAEFLLEHEDLFIVTDIKDDNIRGCKYIADNYPELKNRFIIQIYHVEEYYAIKRLGFNYMIYSLYKTEAAERESDRLIADIKECYFVGVAFWYDWIETKDVYNSVKDIGVPIFVHTVDDKSEIENCMSMNLLIYTNNTDNAWIR